MKTKLFLAITVMLTAYTVKADRVGNGTDPILVDKAVMTREITTRLKKRIKTYFQFFKGDDYQEASGKMIFGALKASSERLSDFSIRLVDSSVGSEACIDQNGKKVPLSTQKGDLGGAVCYDLELLVNGPRPTETVGKLVAQTLHELYHQLNHGESPELYVFEADSSDLYADRNKTRATITYIYKPWPNREDVRQETCVNFYAFASGGRMEVDFSFDKYPGFFSSHVPSIRVGNKVIDPKNIYSTTNLEIPEGDNFVTYSIDSKTPSYLYVKSSFNGYGIARIPFDNGYASFFVSRDCTERAQNAIAIVNP
ncbi:MAG: hypothetical protein AB7F59_14695 [Bdellovibrionales bacterium]